MVNSHVSFLLACFFTGFWMSNMFSGRVVATANGFVEGWGNLGGGVMHLMVDTKGPFFQIRKWRDCSFLRSIESKSNEQLQLEMGFIVGEAEEDVG